MGAFGDTYAYASVPAGIAFGREQRQSAFEIFVQPWLRPGDYCAGG